MSMKGLSLYHFESCPFCERVRKALERLGLDIELRDIEKNSDFYDELVAATGRRTVPCLRTEDSAGDIDWMHESADIIHHLEENVAG